MKKILILFIAVSVPALLFVQTWQVFSFQQMEAEVASFEEQQKEWFEENKREVVGIEYLSSPERLNQLAVEELHLEKIDPDRIVRIVIPNSGAGLDG